MKAKIEMGIPVYGEWVNRNGTQDRPLKGVQPTLVEVDLVVSKIAGVGYIYKEEYIFRNVTDRSLSVAEGYCRKMNYPKWELADFDIITN